MKKLICIICIFFLTACTSTENEPNNTANKADSLHNATSLSTKNELQNIFFNELYPVYELSPKTTAFIVNFSQDETEAKTRLDTIFNSLLSSENLFYLSQIEKSNKLYDTLGMYRLIKSESFQKRVKPYFDKEYYVYGTLGFAKLKFNDILIGLDECKTNFFAFCFDKAKLASIGHPIFCSLTEINLNYSKDYRSIELKLNDYLSKLPADYSDSVSTKILGSVGNFYFTYSDDFLWGYTTNYKCQFPARSVYQITDKSIENKWSESLDLFGIPCD